VSQAAAHARRPANVRWHAAPGEATAYVELAALPLTPFWARRHAQAVLGAWQIPSDTVEVAVLLVSELVTNAVAVVAVPAREPPAASTGTIVQTLRWQPGRIVVEVSDPDPRPPVREEVGPEAESGRGLMLVDVLSKEWSYYFPAAGGKTVYCVLSAPGDSTTLDSQHIAITQDANTTAKV